MRAGGIWWWKGVGSNFAALAGSLPAQAHIVAEMGSSWLAALASVMLMSGLVIEGANAPAALSGAASVATTQAAQPHARRELGFCSPAASLRKLRGPPAVTAAHAIPGLHPVVARSPPAIMAAVALLDPGSVGGFLGAGLRLSAPDLLHRSRVRPARSRVLWCAGPEHLDFPVRWAATHRCLQCLRTTQFSSRSG